MLPGRLSRRELLRRLGALALAASAPAEAFAATPLTVICRDAWGARPPRGSFRRHEIRRATVHHSGVVLNANANAPARFRSHQRAHQARGWPDIAYHLLIDRSGYVYEGRPRWAVGDTSTAYDPEGHLLVLCEGHFGEQEPSEAQVGALVTLLAWAVRRYGVPASAIRGHGDYARTECPGVALERRLPGVRRRVRGTRVPGLEPLCGEAARRRVRAIEAAAG